MPATTELEALLDRHFKSLQQNSEKMIAEVDRHRGDCADIMRAINFETKLIGNLNRAAETLTEQAAEVGHAWQQSADIAQSVGKAAGQAATEAAAESLARMKQEMQHASDAARAAGDKFNAIATRLMRWAKVAGVLALLCAMACAYLGYRMGKHSAMDARSEELIAKGLELEQRQAAEEAATPEPKPRKKRQK